tara:strand:- start:1128 stop:1745 length:618 start_codon:yes stop_codon:yes gene_type:complete
MHRFTIQSNRYLSQDIQAFYHTDYVGYRKPGNPDYINTLKNTYNDYSESMLKNAVQELKSVLLEDLPQILPILQLKSLTVCVVLRAKTNYQPNQLLFKSTIRNVVNQLNSFGDGIDYIVRHTNTKTTHLSADTPNYNNDGAAPYPGITIETSNISSNISDKNILLIDDLYTRTVNIDEDAIQALLDKGAHSVAFYAVGRTVYNQF